MRRIESNLASQPFLNRRVPVAVATSLVGLALLGTALNIGLFVLRGGEYRRHQAQRKAQQERLKSLERDLERENRLLEGREVDEYASESAFILGVLERRRFAWTTLLDHLEDEKPFGVMLNDLAMVETPGGRISIKIRGTANARGEMLKLEDNLLRSPRFEDPRLESEERDPANPWTRFSLSVEYLQPEAP